MDWIDYREKFPYKRTSRKACLVEKTKKNFNFDFYKEFYIYKFAMGLGLTKKEDRMLCDHVKFNTYLEWEDYFIKKTKKLDAKKRKELIAVIDVWSSRRKITKSMDMILLPIILALALEQMVRCLQLVVDWGKTYSNLGAVFVVITVVLTLLIVVLLTSVELTSFVTKIIRCKFLKEHNETAKKQSNIIGLQQLFRQEYWNLTGPIFISEEASEEDVLNRTVLINVIYNSVISCGSCNGHVIGVKGSWGSGKTTILNFVKKKIETINGNDIIIIDDFDPWVFGSQEALLMGLYDEILKGIGIKYSLHGSRQRAQNLKRVLSRYNELSGTLINFIEDNIDDYEAVKREEDRLARMLTQIGKTVLIIVDNLDRAEADNILFLFKLIGTVFKLPNVVYILAYDGERIDAVFSDVKKINPKYVEKIVSQEIVVPDIPKENFKNICSGSINNMLLAYAVDRAELPDYQLVLEIVSKNVSDLRQLKRLINSSFVMPFFNCVELYKPHLLALEVMRFLCPEMYEEIKNSPEYFVSSDRHTFLDGQSIAERNRFNEKGKAYFGKFFDKYGEYKKPLSELFPYVYNFLNKTDLMDNNMDYSYDLEKYMNANISSGKYFDLYFTYGQNDYSRIYEEVENYIKRINSADYEKIGSMTEALKDEIYAEERGEWFIQLQNGISKINLDRHKYVAIGLVKILDKIKDIKSRPYLSLYQRIVMIITMLLCGENKDDVESLLRSFSENYNIILLEEIKLNCDHFEKRGNTNYFNLKETAGELYHELCEQIISNEIDIYENRIYQRRKVWSLLHAIKEDKKAIIHKYLQAIANNENIFRILFDMVSESTSAEGYGYCIKEEYVESLFGTKKVLGHIISMAEAKNDTERFLLMLWDKMMSGEKDQWGETTYYSPVAMELKL